MIVVDSSAVIAIAFGESDAALFHGALTHSERNICSPVSFTECAMVLIGKRSSIQLQDVEELFATLKIDTADHPDAMGRLAAEAFVRFGKGRHPAKLNLGDCFSYALAKSLNAPLLYKGDDFGRTDIASALPAGAQP
ncbi:type II toxin-antitoxin system VapC family toxin [Bosea thiooxidans]